MKSHTPSTVIVLKGQSWPLTPINCTTLKYLGHGSYGIVHLVQHQESGLKMARKTIALECQTGNTHFQETENKYRLSELNMIKRMNDQVTGIV